MNNYRVDTEFFDRYELEKGWDKAKLERLVRCRVLELKLEEAIQKKRVEKLREELLEMELRVFCARVEMFRQNEVRKESGK